MPWRHQGVVERRILLAGTGGETEERAEEEREDIGNKQTDDNLTATLTTSTDLARNSVLKVACQIRDLQRG